MAASTASVPQGLEAFHWVPQPAAERLVHDLLAAFLADCAPAAALAERMRQDTGTRFEDWVEAIHVPETQVLEDAWRAAGFVAEAAFGAGRRWVHPGGLFPALVLTAASATTVWLKVESVADFLAAQQQEALIEGDPGARLRRAVIAEGPATRLGVIERHGWLGMAPPPPEDARSVAAARHAERFRMRRRAFADPREGFTHALGLLGAAIGELGGDETCAWFFAAEREYWQRRNRAAQVQKARQDALGLGWANHDHHTYRSSRRYFADLIGVFERLGCTCRERFYAGREAGWGAQVLEQPRAGIVIFADVDLAPEEVMNDFAHEPLADRTSLGTVGLWCALHGEAFLEAGMHHLECQFDFAALQGQLETRHGIDVMKPFTDLPFLRQAFTEGERWPVREDRLGALLAGGRITPQQAEDFRRHGALGSHLENLERRAGYKGFNQQGINAIIAATDPRRSAEPSGEWVRGQGAGRSRQRR